jgi:hypothetical protein
MRFSTPGRPLTILGCRSGGGGEEKGAGDGAANILYEPVDTISKAKAGGVVESVATEDVASFDVLAATQSGAQGLGHHTYPRMLKFKAGRFAEKVCRRGGRSPAESYEFSADRLQVS